MRADQLKELLKPKVFEVIDTHIPFFKTPKLFRSLGFRFKRGPLITKTNRLIRKQLESFSVQKFDLIWVDKAIYVTKETTVILRQKTNKLVHYTPDMAFYSNRSRLFEKSIPLYDYLITTKTREISFYNRYIDCNRLILTTQGYDIATHRPLHPFLSKEKSVSFIGLAETFRFQIIQQLINSNIKVKLAGLGWRSFVTKNKNNNNLQFLGESLFANDYTNFISSSQFSLGLLSKRFPELHTTRTFEIPACGTALITERNKETSHFFNEDEAIFYSTPEEMVERILYYQSHPKKLEALTIKGRERVIRDGRDYRSSLKGVLEKMGFSF